MKVLKLQLVKVSPSSWKRFVSCRPEADLGPWTSDPGLRTLDPLMNERPERRSGVKPQFVMMSKNFPSVADEKQNTNYNPVICQDNTVTQDVDDKSLNNNRQNNCENKEKRRISRSTGSDGFKLET
ncbi:uncharacterized protein V6R79_002248 [Siganus canaliculatus]